MNQGEAAETIVKMSLNGVESAVRVTGSGIRGAIAIMVALSKNKTQLKGKTKLTNMLKSGKELKVFPVQEKDFELFAKEAKKYGILYSALIDKKGTNLDGFIDIMVRAEDAPKINRIYERFKLSSFDEASIKAEIKKDKIDKMVKEGLEKGVEVKDINDSKFIDEILGKNVNKEKNDTINPSLKRMEKDNPSEHLSKNKKNLEGNTKKDKISVKQELKEIRDKQNSKNKSKQPKTKHKTPKKKSMERI